MRRALLIGSVVVGLALWPATVSADRAECEGVEAAYRAAAANLNMTPEQTETYVRESSAFCWERTREEEAAEAAQAAEEQRAREREEAREVRRKERKEDRTRAHSQRAPTVRKRQAGSLVLRSLSEKHRSWRRRDYGFIDCDHGRVNRTHWRCAIGWGNDRGFQRCGRAMVEGYGFTSRGPTFKVAWQISPNWCWAAD